MKKPAILFFLIFSASLLAQNDRLYESFNYAKAVENGTRSRNGYPGEKYWQNYADYQISVRLDTATKRIFGSEQVVYYNQSPDTLQQIVIRLYPDKYKAEAIRNEAINPENVSNGVTLDTVVINGEGVLLNDSTTRRNGTNLLIKLAHPLPPGEHLEFMSSWNFGLPVAPESRRYGYYKDNAWFVGYFYPQIAVYDDLENLLGFIKGWDFMLFHEGFQEFYNDFNNYSVTIEVPEGFFVWATGELKNAENVLSKKILKRYQKAHETDEIVRIVQDEDLSQKLLKGNIWKYEAKNVTDFGFGTAKDYLWDATSIKEGGRHIFVDAAYPVDSKLFSQTIGVARKTVKYASEDFPGIPFPYPSATTFNGNLSGGMEYPMIANNMDTKDTVTHLLVTFHEIFHNYLPFMMGTNEKRYPFMDEGWAEFFTRYYLKEVENVDVYSDGGFLNLGNGPVGVYDFFAPTADLPLINSYAGITRYNLFYLYYIKPSIAYSLFYDMVGREKFIAAFKEFVNRWQGKHPTPWDFFYTMNDYLGENYNWFWDAWFFNPGYADLGIELKGESAVIKRVGKGSLPLPVYLHIEYTDGTFKDITKPMDIWKDGKTQFEIPLENFDQIKTLSLDTRKVPDVDISNNTVRVNQNE